MVTFDLREKLIPFSLLQITNLFRKMRPGEELEILAGSCPVEAAIFRDVMRILPRDDYDLISQEDIGGEEPVTLLRLRKKRSSKTQQPQGGPSCQQSI